jgi:hypothetical protein
MAVTGVHNVEERKLQWHPGWSPLPTPSESCAGPTVSTFEFSRLPAMLPTCHVSVLVNHAH